MINVVKYQTNTQEDLYIVNCKLNHVIKLKKTNLYTSVLLGRLLMGSAILHTFFDGQKDIILDYTSKIIDATINISGKYYRVSVNNHNPKFRIYKLNDGRLKVRLSDVKPIVISVVVDDKSYFTPTITGEISDEFVVLFNKIFGKNVTCSLGVAFRYDLFQRAKGFIIDHKDRNLDDVANDIVKIASKVEFSRYVDDDLGYFSEIYESINKVKEWIYELSCWCTKESIFEILNVECKPKYDAINLLNQGKRAFLMCEFCGKRYEVTMDDINGVAI